MKYAICTALLSMACMLPLSADADYRHTSAQYQGNYERDCHLEGDHRHYKTHKYRDQRRYRGEYRRGKKHYHHSRRHLHGGRDCDNRYRHYHFHYYTPYHYRRYDGGRYRGQRIHKCSRGNYYYFGVGRNSVGGSLYFSGSNRD